VTSRFKPDKEGETVEYTGISQSACREMALCTELSNANIVHLVEIILQDKCIFMIFEFAEHDLLQIIHHHSQPPRRPIPASIIKSVLHQLLRGILYLHTNWVLHRDLKPANILVTSAGVVKIGDLGLARLFYKPLQPLSAGDKVVVTIWYRAPELLLGTRNYTPAIDLWAAGCIFAELLSLRPIFKGEEAKADGKKQVPFQRSQVQKIVEIMGMPTKERWPGLACQPEYRELQSLGFAAANRDCTPERLNAGLESWYNNTLRNAGYGEGSGAGTPGPQGLDLLTKLLEYDPERRLTAQDALDHPYFFQGGEKTSANCFEGIEARYPFRRVRQDDLDINLPGTKRGGLPDDGLRGAKRFKDG